MYALYLIDADETLFDYHRAERSSLEKTLADEGISFSEEIYQAYAQINAALWEAYEKNEITQEALRVERFARFLAHLKHRGDPEAVSAAYLGHLGESAFLLDGALELAQALHQDARLVLFSNGIAEVQRSRMAHSGLLPYFVGLCISGEMGFQKPDPRMVDAAMAMADCKDKESVLVVGDSQTADIECARRAGVDSCLYNPHAHPLESSPTFVVRHLSEIPPLKKP